MDRLIGDHGVADPAVMEAMVVEYSAPVYRLGVVSTFANTAYVFELQGSGWTYRLRMTPGGGGHDDFMRRTVALSGSTLLLGSPGDLGGGNMDVFELPP